MNRLPSYLFALSCTFFISGLTFAQEQPIPIVQDGSLVEAYAEVVGDAWTQADGYLQQQGTHQYLWAKPVIGPGDFHVTAVLKLQERFNDEGRGSAASFAINDMLQSDGANGSNFGFVGGSGELFTEGNFVASFTDLGDTPIMEDQDFTLDFIREGDTYRFLLDGNEVLSLPAPEEAGDPVFRSGYYRVGLRPWRSHMFIKSFTIVSGAASFDPIEDKIEIVANGVEKNAVEVGEPWIDDDGFIENFETGNFIFSDRPIFGSNYHVVARLQMEDFDGSAAAFTINGDSNVGFSGGSGTMFLEGPFFSNAPSLSIAPPIEANTYFDFEMISQDQKLRFLIDGQEILAMDQPGDFVGFVGFRPWRSVMRIADFYVEPLQETVVVPPEVVRSMAEGRAAVFMPGETIAGVRLTATVAEGQTSNAVITDVLPEGWSAQNLQADNGSASYANGRITWSLDNAQSSVRLTYDLSAPSDPASTKAEFSGSVDTTGVDGLITGLDELVQAVGPNQEVYIVRDGRLTEYAETLGEPWLEVAGAMERTGTNNFLLSSVAVADVDYEIDAELTLFGVGGTASSINIRTVPGGAQSNFGFEGGGGTFFVEGPFFDPRPSFDYTTIAEAVPFTFAMQRTGTSVDFLMDDQVIHTEEENHGEAFTIGLRPWRSRMQVREFVIRTFAATAVPEWPLY
ncbi:MAG: hypothetical protein GC154_17800 [bacterium]|nr:hypothetical protein [bacterium]